MQVLIAPDDFKGTFSAPQVAAAIAAGVRDAGAEADELPIADGGNGTMEAIVASLGGEIHHARVSDPLGRLVDARWALLPDGRTAAIDMAEASGLWRGGGGGGGAGGAGARGGGGGGLAPGPGGGGGGPPPGRGGGPRGGGG